MSNVSASVALMKQRSRNLRPSNRSEYKDPILVSTNLNDGLLLAKSGNNYLLLARNRNRNLIFKNRKRIWPKQPDPQHNINLTLTVCDQLFKDLLFSVIWFKLQKNPTINSSWANAFSNSNNSERQYLISQRWQYRKNTPWSLLEYVGKKK